MGITGAAVWRDCIRVKILDDDVDFKTLLPQNLNNTLDDDIGDDNPAVAEFVDERPQHVKEMERFRQSKQWKLVSQKPGTVGDFVLPCMSVLISTECLRLRLGAAISRILRLRAACYWPLA